MIFELDKIVGGPAYRIMLDGEYTGLNVAQENGKTMVFRSPSFGPEYSFCEYAMPYSRYAFSAFEETDKSPGFPTFCGDIELLLFETNPDILIRNAKKERAFNLGLRESRNRSNALRARIKQARRELDPFYDCE